MKTPHAVVQLLRASRDTAARLLTTTMEFGVAVNEVADELLRRAEVIADLYPEDQPITLTEIKEAGAIGDAITSLLKANSALAQVVGDYFDAIMARRTPLINFLRRVESEGFTVTNDFTVIDTSGGIDAPDPAVESALRAERTKVYQERLRKMSQAFGDTTLEFAERARNVIPTFLGG